MHKSLAFQNRMNQFMNVFVILIGFTMMGFPLVATAYVGPGAGVTLVGSLLGLIFAVFFVLIGILSWPLRMLWRRFFAKKHLENTSAAASSDSDKYAVNETEEKSHG